MTKLQIRKTQRKEKVDAILARPSEVGRSNQKQNQTAPVANEEWEVPGTTTILTTWKQQTPLLKTYIHHLNPISPFPANFMTSS